MSQIETLSPLAHRTMGIKTDYFPHLGYNIGSVMVLPNELNRVQKEYPILLRRHPESGRLFPTALLGFAESENLFIDDQGRWHARYIPMVIRKGPFLIGFHSGEPGSKPVVLVDKSDPRVQADGASRLFIGSGRPSEYLNSVSQLLVEIHQGAEQLGAMLSAFDQAGVVEPLHLELEFINGQRLDFSGAYTISQARLREIEPDSLEVLASQGFLNHAVSVANSISNLDDLIERKNARLLKLSRGATSA